MATTAIMNPDGLSKGRLRENVAIDAAIRVEVWEKFSARTESFPIVYQLA
ncbi:MAG: hypothetical protein WKF71_07800 [Pyrinomonadaceae bacterium]